MLRGRRRQRRPAHVGEADPAALEQRAFFDQPREAFPLQLFAGCLEPGVANEGPLTVGGLECVDNPLLQTQQVVARGPDLL